MQNKIMWLITWISIFSLAIYVFIDRYHKPKTGYILIQEVYAQFDLKKELEQKFIALKNIRQKGIDSLAFELKLLAKKIDAENGKNKEDEILYNRKREEYYLRSQTMTQENEQLTQQYDKEILSQLNQYVHDYGNENGYQYILGSDGNGSIMHADESENLTKEVSAYINNKYKGAK